MATTALAHNPEVASARGTLDKAHAGLRASRLEFVPDVSLFAEHVYQNGVPLLPDNSVTFGVRLDWTLSEFGKRTGKMREQQSQVAQAKENLNITDSRIRMDVEKHLRKYYRSVSAVQAAQTSVAAHADLRRIVSDQVEAKTANASALADAEAKLAEAQAQLFAARVESITAKAELDQLLGDAK